MDTRALDNARWILHAPETERLRLRAVLFWTEDKDGKIVIANESRVSHKAPTESVPSLYKTARMEQLL